MPFVLTLLQWLNPLNGHLRTAIQMDFKCEHTRKHTHPCTASLRICAWDSLLLRVSYFNISFPRGLKVDDNTHTSFAAWRMIEPNISSLFFFFFFLLTLAFTSIFDKSSAFKPSLWYFFLEKYKKGRRFRWGCLMRRFDTLHNGVVWTLRVRGQ